MAPLHSRTTPWRGRALAVELTRPSKYVAVASAAGPPADKETAARHFRGDGRGDRGEDRQQHVEVPGRRRLEAAAEGAADRGPTERASVGSCSKERGLPLGVDEAVF